MDNIRLFLLITLAFVTLMLWEAWQKDHAPTVPTPTSEISPTPDPTPLQDLPVATPDVAAPTSEPLPPAQQIRAISVTTDILQLTISLQGGTVERTSLTAYPVHTSTPDQPIELLGSTGKRTFVYQGGLAGGSMLPDHHAVYEAGQEQYRLAEGRDELVVPFSWRHQSGVTVEKRYIFQRDSYLIRVEYVVVNSGTAPLRAQIYEQLKRTKEDGGLALVYTFSGPILSTPQKRFEKYDFDDLTGKALDVSSDDAWIGVMQHYFVAALIPIKGVTSRFYSKVLGETEYLVGYLGPATEIPVGATTTFAATTYVGPKRHDIVSNITSGLELTVDYGFLWFIAKPLFISLQFIHDLTGNWGWGIIIVTLILKLLFYPLSAAGYRSMAKMRLVQPRMLALRDRYIDDRAQLNQAMMKLYKDEKINPLGGCFPILIQIPVFISLYWVLLESVEMRQAPFILWIADLSEKDPYFVLPLLMGISMWLQQKLNPAPLDPTQAKVMQLLPFVFTVFFAFFPSGLVLYWVVNNILSMAQQWQITRAIEQGQAS